MLLLIMSTRQWDSCGDEQNQCFVNNSSEKIGRTATLKLLEDPSLPTIFWRINKAYSWGEKKIIVGRPTNSLMQLPPFREVHYLFLIVIALGMLPSFNVTQVYHFINDACIFDIYSSSSWLELLKYPLFSEWSLEV